MIVTPAPMDYHPEKAYEKAIHYGKISKALGASQTQRQALQRTPPLSHVKLTLQGSEQVEGTPGPAEYQPVLPSSRVDIRHSAFISMLPRFGTENIERVPGPGTYNVTSNLIKQTYNASIKA